NDDHYIKRATTNLKMYKYTDVIDDCHYALKINKNCVKAYILLSKYYKHRGQLSISKEYLNKGLNISEENKNLSIHISNLKTELSIIEKMENLFEKVNEQMKNGNYKNALQTLEETMILCDSKISSNYQSNKSLSILKSDELRGIPIRWRLLRAEILIMNNDYHEAMTIAEIILAKDKNNSEALALKTKLLYIMGKSNIDNAVKYLRKAVYYYNKNEDAKKLIEKIPELEEKKKEIINNLFKAEHYEEAIQKYDKLINDCKEIYLTGIVLIILLRNKSTCLLKLKKYSECIECTTEAIEILKSIVFENGEPKSNDEYKHCKQQDLFFELYKKRLEGYIKDENFQKAKEDCEIFKMLKPIKKKLNIEELYRNEKIILSNLEREKGNNSFNDNDFKKALDFYNKSLEIYLNNNKSYFNRGLAYMKLFKYEKAIEDFRNAYRYDNQYIKAINNLSICYLQILEPEKALNEIGNIDFHSDSNCVKTYNISKKLHDMYKEIRNYSFNYEKSIEKYKLLLDEYHNYKISGYIDVLIYKKIASLYQNSSKHIEGIECITKAIKKLKDLVFSNGESESKEEYESCGKKDLFFELYKEKIESHIKIKNFSSAKEDCETLKMINPINKMLIFQILKKKGNIAFKNDDYKKAFEFYKKSIAIEDFRNAYRYDNQYIKAINNLSICYLQILEPEKALNEIGNIDFHSDSNCVKTYNISKKLHDMYKEIRNYSFNYEKSIEKYKLLLDEYHNYKISGYIDVLIYKKIASLYQNLNKTKECIIHISISIEMLEKKVIKDNNPTASTYKESDFCDLFIDLFKIRAKSYFDDKNYQKAYEYYKDLFHMCPYDHEIQAVVIIYNSYSNSGYNNYNSYSSNGNNSYNNNSNSNSRRERKKGSNSYSEYECCTILGLDQNNNPTIKDIKNAYRKLALKYHLDKCKDENLRKEYEEKMKEINIAKETLMKIKGKN
ncbi:TPR-like protein, partial [Piromyces finnis]